MELMLGVLLFALGLVIYLVVYLSVPLIVASSKKLTRTQINLLAVVNVITVFVLLQLIHPYLSTNIVMGVFSFFLARHILISKCLKVEDEVQVDMERKNKTYICISAEDEKPNLYGTSLTTGADVRLERSIEYKGSTPEKPISQPTEQSFQKVKYCSRCGNPIDSVSKKCLGCGKQYFKGIAMRTVVILLVMALCVSIAGNILLAISRYEHQNRIVELIKTIEQLELDTQSLAEKRETIALLETDKQNLAKQNHALKVELENQNEKIDFYDEYIVFVKNETNIYHHFDCDEFSNDFVFWLDDGVFWAYNEDYAIYKGYMPCPLCCD